LEIHIVDTLCELLVNDPEVLGQQLVSLVAVVQSAQDVLEIAAEMFAKQCFGLRAAKDLECNPVQSERSKFDLVQGQELSHQRLLRAHELFVVDDKQPLRHYLTV